MNRMTTSLRAAGLAVLLFAPANAFAQPAPPGGAEPAEAPPVAIGTPNPRRLAAMQAMRANLEALHRQTRLQMLGALTAQQRTQLASIVGQLAIAPAPDPAVAAKQIDGMLSAAQARTILTSQENERTSARNLFQSARAAFEATLTPAERAAMPTRPQHMQDPANRPTRASDPGFALLHTALGFAGPHGPHGL